MIKEEEELFLEKIKTMKVRPSVKKSVKIVKLSKEKERFMLFARKIQNISKDKVRNILRLWLE